MDERITGNGWYVELWLEMNQEQAQARTLAAYKAQGGKKPEPQWGSLIGNGWGQTLFNFLKSKGAEGDDTLTEPVYNIGRDEKNGTIYLVPVSRYYDAGKVKFIPKYREVHVGYDATSQADLQAQINQNNTVQTNGPPVPTPGVSTGSSAGTTSSGGVSMTYELYGLLNGGPVPLARVLLNTSAGYQVVTGGRLMLGNAPTDGFGLAGMPGKWSQTYPTTSPTQYGLDADKGVLGFDGSRAWAIPATTLSQLFGSNWRQAIYV